MQTAGRFAPATLAAARERYEALGPTAQTVVREVARAMEFDREEYDQRVTTDVVETARQALFAAQLAVHVGTAEEFDDWRAETGREVTVAGSDAVDNVAWHDPAFANTAIAATFQDEQAAAVDTCRRMAFNRLYRDVLE